MKVLGDIQGFPTICGNPNHADVLHGISGVQQELVIRLFLPGCTKFVHLVVNVFLNIQSSLRSMFRLLKESLTQSWCNQLKNQWETRKKW